MDRKENFTVHLDRKGKAENYSRGKRKKVEDALHLAKE